MGAFPPPNDSRWPALAEVAQHCVPGEGSGEAGIAGVGAHSLSAAGEEEDPHLQANRGNCDRKSQEKSKIAVTSTIR